MVDCSVVECLRPAFRRGLCAKHYEEDRKAKAPRCAIADCGLPVHGKGYCEAHYRIEVRSKTRPCSIESCGRPSVSHGLCDAHRLRNRNHGFLDATRPADWGGRTSHPLYHTYAWLRRKRGIEPICERWDDFWAFVEDMGHRPDPRARLRRKDETQPFSAENCFWQEPVLDPVKASSKAEYMREWQRRRRASDPDRYRSYDRKKHYGLSGDEHRALLEQQGGRCAICRQEERAVSKGTGLPRSLAVDHCHSTGAVRGLLCTSCNMIIGNANDSTDLLKKAIAYLETSNCNRSP